MTYGVKNTAMYTRQRSLGLRQQRKSKRQLYQLNCQQRQDGDENSAYIDKITQMRPLTWNKTTKTVMRTAKWTKFKVPCRLSPMNLVTEELQEDEPPYLQHLRSSTTNFLQRSKLIQDDWGMRPLTRALMQGLDVNLYLTCLCRSNWYSVLTRKASNIRYNWAQWARWMS